MPTTTELAEHLLQTAPDYEGWSLVESPNSAGCYDDLREWAASMNYAAWRSDSRIRHHQLGLVLLWLESEIARRHGGEGSLWPILRNQEFASWHPTIHSELFNVTGAATPQHRELLKNAANHYGLRQTFSEEKGKHWYRLICLQFGFNHDDAVKRLSSWLSGHKDNLQFSVQRLLDSHDPGALEFQQVWRSLRMFRLGNLPKAMLESRLRANPWVLHEWCGELIEAAKKSSAQLLEVADLDAIELRFFTTPRLCLSDTGQPYFTTSLCNLSEIGLKADEYQLKAGVNILARLIRQPDGTYYSDAPETIVLPLQPTIALSLIGDDGKLIGHDEVNLWDSMEEVSVYSPKTGLMIPAGQKIRSGAELFLIASADITIHPTPAESLNVGLGYCLHRNARGWSGKIEACLDDDVIWSNEAVPGVRPDDAVGVSARFTSALDLRAGTWADSKPPWELPIQIHIPHGWTFSRLRWRRSDGKRVEYDQIPAHLTLVEQDAVRPVVLRVRIHDGTRHRTDVLRVSVPFVAALKWTKEGRPYHHEPGRKLLLGDATKYAWSFSLPTIHGEPRNPRTCSFLEGNTLHQRLKSRPTTLPDLGGYGASLCIVDDPYQAAKPLMEAAPCVLDGGVLGNVTWDTEKEAFHIRSSFTELGNDHQLLAWYSDGEGCSRLRAIAPNAVAQLEDGWLWNSSGHVHLHAVALFFRGCRLGSWFDFSSSSRAAVDKPPGNPKEVAALIRAWKAPVLQRDGDHYARYCEWTKNHWVDALPIWLAKDGQMHGPSDFAWNVPQQSSDWFGTVGDLLLGCLPDPSGESAGNLVESLAPGMRGMNAIGQAIWQIVEVCPILAVRVARVFINEFVTPRERQQFFTLMLGFSELSTSDERAEEIGRIHGNRDGFWLQQTIPDLHAIHQNGPEAIPHAYRLLAKSQDYRHYALGRLLQQIR